MFTINLNSIFNYALIIATPGEQPVAKSNGKLKVNIEINYANNCPNITTSAYLLPEV